MLLLPTVYKLWFVAILFLKEIVCFCENSYIVICDNIADIEQNDTTTWKYVQIGSPNYRPEPPNQILTSNIFIRLSRTSSLTIIRQVRRIKTPLTVSYAKKFEYLNFYENHINEIEDYTFENLPALKEIYLKKNSIHHLGRALFKNTSLDIVDLSQNQIESVTTCFYESKIKSILLNHNKIGFIKGWKTFPAVLETLELSHNNLQTLEHDVFSNLHQLKELFLEYNQFSTLPDVSSLKQVKYLHLANNYIQEVHYRFDTHLPNLEFLDLSSNLISNVTVDAFSSPKSPPLVMLAFNRLTDIKFTHPERKTDLVLYGNPWNCDCWIYVEKTVSTYRHMRSCEFNFFDKGEIPFCIENGKCGDQYLLKSDLDYFRSMVTVREQDIKRECNFRL